LRWLALPGSSGRRRPAGPRSPLRRRLGTAVRMTAALLLVGGLYAAFAPGVQATATSADTAADVAEGKQLYDASCISCHGRNGQGVPDKGPSLIGVGSAAVEFQVATGRMPAPGQGAQIARKTPLYTRDEARQIGAYIQELGGGPELPSRPTSSSPTATWPAAAPCSGSTARPATPSAPAVARCPRASTPRRWRSRPRATSGPPC
jgi:mono/diheme cytochrome c family protein